MQILIGFYNRHTFCEMWSETLLAAIVVIKFWRKKMIVKIYALVWFLGFSAVGITYFTGNLSSVMVVLFGFLSFGAIFMGMMNVLPEVAVHSPANKH